MKRDSRDYCSYTCPAVDGAFLDAVGDLRELVPKALHDTLNSIMETLEREVKTHGTERLRAALNEACSDLDDLDEEVRELEARLADARELA